MSNTCEEIRFRLSSAEAGRRLGQALWMMEEAPSSPADLLWAQSLLGRDAEQLLWKALREASCIDENSRMLRPRALARFMCYLVDGEEENRLASGLVWTLPTNLLRVPGLAGDGYAKALRGVVASAKHGLAIVSPYLEASGVGLLEEALITALQRGVSIVLLGHDAEDLSSMASTALRSLQSEARRQPGKLAVYTTAAEGVLLHLKIVVADGSRGLVGSANLTGKGLTANVEVGALVGAEEADELCQVVDQVIASGLTKHVFSTR